MLVAFAFVSRLSCLLSFLLCLLMPSLPAHAAAWRCGQGSSVSYSDQPCTGGQALAPEDQPDRKSASSAAARAASDKQLADKLMRERQRREAAEQSARARAQAAKLAHDKHCKLLEMKARWGAEDAARTDLRHEAKARRHARRKIEQYELECKPG